MKRITYIFLLATLFSVALLTAQDFTVQSVTGSVRVEKSPGVWEKIAAGTSLTLTSQINVGLNSTLVIGMGEGEDIMIGAMQKGLLKDLLEKNSKGSGISLGGSLAENKFNTDTGKDRTNISTASTRASDAQNDVEWMEEEEE